MSTVLRLKKQALAALGLAVLGAGCQMSRQLPAPSMSSATFSRQLLVRLEPPLACGPEDIAKLARSTGERITFLRRMSGAVCVIALEADTDQLLAQGVEVLRRAPGVEWIERDEVMTIRH